MVIKRGAEDIQDKTENSIRLQNGYKLNDYGAFLKTRFFGKNRETSFHFRGDFSVWVIPSLKMNSRFFLHHENSVFVSPSTPQMSFNESVSDSFRLVGV